MKSKNLSFERAEKKEIESLILSAQDGDQSAFEALRKAYIPLLESQSAKHLLQDMTVQDVEDMRQEALIVFCNAVRSYNCVNSGVEFGLYAKICIENGLVSFVRSYLRRKQNSVLPLDFLRESSHSGAGDDPLQAFIDKENRDELVRAINNNLSEYENRVWWLYVSGMSVSEIAKTIGATDTKSVSNAVYRIRKKLRAYISEQNDQK